MLRLYHKDGAPLYGISVFTSTSTFVVYLIVALRVWRVEVVFFTSTLGM